jgi:hypothetical protein
MLRKTHDNRAYIALQPIVELLELFFSKHATRREPERKSRSSFPPPH